MAFFPLGIPSRALDANGDPVSGAKLYVYDAGTTTPATVYQDAALTTPHASPIVADSDGVWAPMWAAAGDYKVNATDASGTALPGFPIDDIEPLISNDDFVSALSEIQNGVAMYLDRAALAAATVPAAVKRVYVMHHTAANHEGDATNQFVSGHFMKRVSFADLSGLYPAASYTRSVDRFLPSGSTNSTNGGYWLIDEESPTVAMFGGVANAALDGSNVITGTDCSAAAQAWIDFYYARANSTRNNIGTMKWGDGLWRLSSGLDFTILSTYGRLYEVNGFGATLYCDCADEIAFDFTDCEYFVLNGFHAYGSPTDTPVCFVKTGRFADNNTAARFRIENCSTRVNASATSQWRQAALWVMASETWMEDNCVWENYRDRVASGDTSTVAAAFDSTNFLDWGAPVAVSSITKANPGVVTTSGAHGFSTGDIVAFSEDCDMTELGGLRFKVVVTSGTTFTMTDLAGAAINTTAYTTFTTGSVHKEKWGRGTSLSMFATADQSTSPSIKERQSTSTPYERNSFKHIQHNKCIYSAELGRAAIWQGACEDNQFIACFAVSDTGIWFKFEDATTGFTSSKFDVHLERGSAGSESNDWGRFSLTFTSQTECNVIDCEFREVALNVDTFFMRVDDGTENVSLYGGKIAVGRFTSAFIGTPGQLFSNANRFHCYQTDVVLDRAAIAGTEVVNSAIFSGRITEENGSVGILRLPLFTMATLPDTQIWEGGLIIVTDETGGEVLCFSDNNNWRRVTDRAIAS